MSELRKGLLVGKKNGMFGRKQSKEAKRKISLALKGDKNGFFGKKHSEKTKLQMSKNHANCFGKNNPQWKGGKTKEVYSKEFIHKLKEQIRKRDNYTCQYCNIKQENLNRKLCVHHIDYDKENNAPENLLSLCGTCHAKTTTMNRSYWINFFTERMVLCA